PSRAHPALHSFPTRRSSDLRHGEGRRPVARRLLANRKASEPPDRFAKVGPELLTAIGEARASPREGAVAQEIGEEFDAGLSQRPDRKSTRLNSSHVSISYAV